MDEWHDPDVEFPLKGAGERVNDGSAHLDLNHRAIVRELICNTVSEEGAHMQRRVHVLHPYDPVAREAATFLENV
jgi:hypothetical protein